MMTTPKEEPRRFVLTGIPANLAGKRFIAQFRQYVNRDYGVRVRGTGPHPDGSRRRGQVRPRIKDSEAYQIYLDSPFERDWRLRCYAVQNSVRDFDNKLDEATGTVSAQRAVIKEYLHRVVGAAVKIDALTKERDFLVREVRILADKADKLATVPRWILWLCRWW